MSKRQLLCVLGVWVAVFLFLGFPADWQKIIAVISGLLIISIAYNLPAPDSLHKAMPQAFAENKTP